MHARGPNIFDVADKFSGPPSGGRGQLWILGVLLPLFPAGYGLWCCITGHAKTFNITLRGFQPMGRGLFLDVYGPTAASLGLALFFLGLFLHFHYFWSHHRTLYRYYEVGKVSALTGLLISVGIHIDLTLF